MKGLRKSFQRGQNVEYGLAMTERDPSTSAVFAVLCQLCLKFALEAKPGAKRKSMKNVQMFKAPLSTEVYKKHHANVHPEKWQNFLTC